jgi:hypothetical protein
MQSFDFKRLLPHLAIVGIMAVIALVFSYPALQGKMLAQGDNISWKAMSNEAMQWHEKTGENTLWTNSMFGGMPTYTFYVPESKNTFAYIQKTIETILVKPAYFFFVCMLSFYVLMCVLRVNRWLGLIGAIAFAFSYNPILIAAGHDTKVVAIAYLPLVISAMIILYRGNYILGGIFAAIAFASALNANHLQISYYMGILMLIFGIVLFFVALREKWLPRFFKASAIAVVAFIIGMGPGMGNILTTQEYAKETMRGGQSELTFNHDQDKAKKGGGLDKEYAFRWSNGIGETFALMIPYLYGGSSSEPLEQASQAGEFLANAGYGQVPMYWGPQELGIAGPIYFGAIICFLFVFGLMVVRSPHKWWIVIASVFMIILSWGRHFEFNYFLFDNMPLYNKFRAPTSSLAIPQFLFPMLGIWALVEVINGKVSKEEALKKLKIALGITAGICILFAFAGSMFFDYTNPVADKDYPAEFLNMLKEDRAELARNSSLKSAIFILLAGGLIWAFIKDKINKSILIAGIGVLVAIDLFSVAASYLNDDNYQEESDYNAIFQPRPVDQQILQDTDPHYRVLDLTRNVYNDAVQAYFHKSIGGYSPAKLEIYQDMIDVHLGANGFNAQVLNMLNTKYIIFDPGNKQPTAQINNDANGNAWFVNNIKWAKTADEEILSLKGSRLGDTATVTDAFDTKNSVVIREKYKSEIGNMMPGKDSSSAIVLTKYGLNDLTYKSNNRSEGFGVFSEIYYEKGWEAFIDGKQVPIYRVNYLLRGLKIPAGEHKIEFFFRPKTYAIGDNIAMISSILLYGLIITAIVMIWKGKNPTPAVEEKQP